MRTNIIASNRLVKWRSKLEQNASIIKHSANTSIAIFLANKKCKVCWVKLIYEMTIRKTFYLTTSMMPISFFFLVLGDGEAPKMNIPMHFKALSTVRHPLVEQGEPWKQGRAYVKDRMTVYGLGSNFIEQKFNATVAGQHVSNNLFLWLKVDHQFIMGKIRQVHFLLRVDLTN